MHSSVARKLAARERAMRDSEPSGPQAGHKNAPSPGSPIQAKLDLRHRAINKPIAVRSSEDHRRFAVIKKDGLAEHMPEIPETRTLEMPYPDDGSGREQSLREVKHEGQPVGESFFQKFWLHLLAILWMNIHKLSVSFVKWMWTGEKQGWWEEEPGAAQLLCNSARSWAVIIGINDYPEGWVTLEGSVNDAHLVQEFLVDDLGIPDSHIVLLTTELQHQRPTRDNILKALYDLRDNRRIKYDDDIIIYFSGHGSRYNASISDDRPCWVETLCPCDVSSKTPQISVRELNLIVEQIMATKGHNVVVILDSCHSGGLASNSSDAPNTYLTERAITTQDTADMNPMLRAADQHPRKKSDASVFTKLREPKPFPCVFMMACKDKEVALETEFDLGDCKRRYGVFTYLLVETLREMGVADSRTTYADIERQLAASLEHPIEPIEDAQKASADVQPGPQHAHMAGDKRKRRLWFHFDKWLAAHVYMSVAKQLLERLVKTLCGRHEYFLIPDGCHDCLATRCAFEALETYIDFAVNTAKHQELDPIQTRLRQMRDKSGLDRVRKHELHSMPVVLDGPFKQGGKERGTPSLPLHLPSVTMIIDGSDVLALDGAFRPLYSRHTLDGVTRPTRSARNRQRNI
ncbi:hypothetical protein EWM64_g2640 [Hericium alpestre]|uniref:Peptidase C14 caspase domain-containing protein n=1 Tax=Hericium alpestre TaxID=135208 RepID=A0A4Z0A632_9AGAM|nr:hypothetical protein EWM64_g2640 [Hericium alpestre]